MHLRRQATLVLSIVTAGALHAACRGEATAPRGSALDVGIALASRADYSGPVFGVDAVTAGIRADLAPVPGPAGTATPQHVISRAALDASTARVLVDVGGGRAREGSFAAVHVGSTIAVWWGGGLRQVGDTNRVVVRQLLLGSR